MPTLRRWLLLLLVVALLAAPFVIWRGQIAGLFADRARLAAQIRGAGAWGPLLIAGLAAAQVVAAPIPGQAVEFVAGYLYGFWLGSLYSWLGLMAGSALAMGIARVAGRPLLVRLLNAQTLERLDRFAYGQGLGFFFLVFLFPFLPDDAACFLAGLTALPLPAVLLVAAVGRVPGMAVAVWAGTRVEQLSWTGWLVTCLLAVAGLIVVWRYGGRIQDALLRRFAAGRKLPVEDRAGGR